MDNTFNTPRFLLVIAGQDASIYEGGIRTAVYATLKEAARDVLDIFAGGCGDDVAPGVFAALEAADANDKANLQVIDDALEAEGSCEWCVRDMATGEQLIAGSEVSES